MDFVQYKVDAELGGDFLNAKQWIEHLKLIPHPEGGYYRETYHAQTLLTDSLTEQKYGGKRRSATSIYFLLEGTDVSRFHRLRSDEIWYFHAGSSLTVHTITPDGSYMRHQLGLDVAVGQQPQLLIPSQHIFGATVNHTSEDDFALVSCMVSPGFDFQDFELFDRQTLIALYPEHKAIISRLTQA